MMRCKIYVLLTYCLRLQMLRSIVDVNLPKFLAHDVPLFHGIINDLFPGVTLPRVEHTQFLEAVEKICRQNNLQNVPFFTEKLVQMYEMMLVRHGYVDDSLRITGVTSVDKVQGTPMTLGLTYICR